MNRNQPDDEIDSLNRREARFRGNGSALASDNSDKQHKTSRRRRRKSPKELDLNADTTPEKLKQFAQADRQLQIVANSRQNRRDQMLNGSRTSPMLRQQKSAQFRRNSRYPPLEETMKDTTKLGQTWVKEKQLGKLKKNKKKNEQKTKQKKRIEIFSSDDENDPPPRPSTRSIKKAITAVSESGDSEMNFDPELHNLLQEAQTSKCTKSSFWKKKDKSKKVEILAPDTPELDRRGPKTSPNMIVSDSD
jgi:hypothetical protein